MAERRSTGPLRGSRRVARSVADAERSANAWAGARALLMASCGSRQLKSVAVLQSRSGVHGAPAVS